jgi:hypothetical protein
LLLSDGLTVVSGAVILPGVSDDVLQAIIVIFQHRNQVARLLLHHAEIELAASASAAEVFQEASPAGRLLQVYAKRYARVYLREALGAEIKRYGTRHIGPPLSLSRTVYVCLLLTLCAQLFATACFIRSRCNARQVQPGIGDQQAQSAGHLQGHSRCHHHHECLAAQVCVVCTIHTVGLLVVVC